MKYFVYITIISILFAACTSDQNNHTSLTLILENAEVDQAEMTILKDFISFNRETISATTDENGYFVFTPLISHSQMVFLTVGNRRMLLYLDEGAQLKLNADMNDWDSTITYSGDLSNENNFLIEVSQEIEPRFGQNQLFMQYRSSSEDEFRKFVNEGQAASLELLNNYDKKNKLSKAFKSYFTTDLNYTRYSSLINYSSYYAYFNNEEPELSAGYYDFMEEALHFSDDKFIVPSFVGFLDEYLRYYLGANEDKVPSNLNDFEKSLWIANDLYTGKARDYALASLINSELNWGEFKPAEAAYIEFREISPYQDLTDLLQQSYDGALRIAPGNPAPNFTLTNIDGEEVTLADFAGKVVYLDFWASWCGPCMREVPHAKELKKRFDGQEDLVFLYISVDEDPQAWIKAVEQHQIQGVHLNIKGMNAETAQLYNVRGVPSFFIIDRDGTIHNNNPARPSSGDVIDEQLRTVLGV